MPTFRPLAALLAFAALALVAPAQAQTGQQLYNTYCGTCHGPAAQNNQNVLGGKDWNITYLAMDTKPEMNANLRPLYNAGIITNETFQTIAAYLQTITGGVTSRLSMPAAINFGSLAVGVASPVVSRNVTAAADANAATQISTVTSSNPLEFVITTNTCNGAFIFPGSPPCTVGVQFTPAASGARSGQIVVTSNGIGSPQNFAVSGTGGTAPPPPPPPTGSLTVPSSFNFGSLNVGVQGLAQAIVLTNNSGASVTVSNVTVGPTSDFTLSANLCGTVPNGGNCSILVAFRPSQAGTRQGTVSITSSGSGSPQTVTLSGTGVGTTPPPQANKVTVVEYYNAGFGHYFTTAQADEIAGLDAGAFGGAFVRTGRVFNAWDAQAAGTVPVCRFFTLTFAPKSSHFYTADAPECQGLKSNPNWAYEKIAFYIAVPTAGVCPAGTVPIYRMYNNGQTQAPNHRFLTDFAIYADFTGTKNWSAEGIGFCAPP